MAICICLWESELHNVYTHGHLDVQTNSSQVLYDLNFFGGMKFILVRIFVKFGSDFGSTFRVWYRYRSRSPKWPAATLGYDDYSRSATEEAEARIDHLKPLVGCLSLPKSERRLTSQCCKVVPVTTKHSTAIGTKSKNHWNLLALLQWGSGVEAG